MATHRRKSGADATAVTIAVALLPSIVALLGAVGAAYLWGVRLAVLVGAAAALGIALGGARRRGVRAALLLLLAPLPAVALWAGAPAAAPADLEARASALERAGDVAWLSPQGLAAAAQRYQEATAQRPSYPTFLKLARAQLALGQAPAAAESLRRAKASPDAPSAPPFAARTAAWIAAGRSELARAALDATLYASLTPEGLR